MPRIADAYLECVFYLYRSREHADSGADTGGTGFFVTFPIEPELVSGVTGLRAMYAVANKHVVSKGFLLMRTNTVAGGTVTTQTTEANWIYHPDADIAVAPIMKAAADQFLAVPRDVFASDDVVREKDLGPGDEVFMVGRFVGHDGRQQNTPSVRFGHISMMPGDPIRVEGIKPQQSYLVEVRSLPGYSGSPVFAWILPFAVRPGAATIEPTQHGPFLLGIDWCHIEDRVRVEQREPSGKYRVSEQALWAKQPTGMMGVIPTQKLIELLKSDPVRKLRADAVSAKHEPQKS
jgi:hypothetical protein